MDIAVLLRAVPDPIEELELNDDETDLDRDYLGYVLNEFDDHALEEALLLKEDSGGSVTAYALGTADEVEQMLHTAVAKGADRAVKVGDNLGRTRCPCPGRPVRRRPRGARPHPVRGSGLR